MAKSKRKKSSFAGRVNRSAKKKQKNKGSYGYLHLPKDVPLFKAVAGKVFNFDIIPYIVTDEHHLDRDDETGDALPGDPWFKKPFKIHRNVGSGNNKTSVVCLTTIGKKCPICEYQKKRYNEGAKKEELAGLRTSLRNLYILVPKGHKKYEETYHIWDFADTNFQELLDEECENNEANEVFADLAGGKTLKVRFSEGKVDKNKFPKAGRIDFEDRDEDYDEDVLKEVPNLDEVLKILSYKELEKMFFETDDEDEDTREFEEVDDDEEDDHKGKKKRTSKKPKEKDKTKPKSKKECPENYRFGKDFEKYEECGDCDLWDSCSEEKQRLKKAKKDGRE